MSRDSVEWPKLLRQSVFPTAFDRSICTVRLWHPKLAQDLLPPFTLDRLLQTPSLHNRLSLHKASHPTLHTNNARSRTHTLLPRPLCAQLFVVQPVYVPLYMDGSSSRNLSSCSSVHLPPPASFIMLSGGSLTLLLPISNLNPPSL
ncbi:hypothetical protein E2C01_080239 [Portunus trituberculatus]|uniref:Uncharacterized protein n=1 Tax=Portunus trituberculatus TaxID=210409 RepID=A0A5B7IJ32_PORTR|nr:hypothetical protein [Portunus trituberculatus]